jgi:hypothetical protein
MARERADVVRRNAMPQTHRAYTRPADPARSRSRWGSCSAKGDLMFSFRLIMTPPEILDYVAAHEVAHLVEMNHGPAFWTLCHRLCPHDRHPSPLAQGPRRGVSRLALRAARMRRPEPMLTNPRPTDTGAAVAHDRVYRALRTRIMHGEVGPGEAMTLRGLGREFGVSMTPAREAVRRLVSEGALFLSASGRVSTPELSNERIEELAAIRALLEPELSARALPRAHPALIERMDAINTTIAQNIARRDAVGYIRSVDRSVAAGQRRLAHGLGIGRMRVAGRARSCAEAPNSIATQISWIRSPAIGPMIWAPRMRSVSLSARILTKPSAAKLALARPLPMN